MTKKPSATRASTPAARIDPGADRAPASTENRETIEVAVGPNVDGHAHQAIAAQTPAEPEE